MNPLRYLGLAALAALLGLGSSIGSVSGGAFAQAQGECTVTAQPGDSIQAAIDSAQEGAVICLAEGTWEENVKIEKSLTLQGVDQEKTIIKGQKKGYPVVWLTTPEEVRTVSVKVEGLTITEAQGWCTDSDKGICANGLLIRGSAQVTISDSTISENGVHGIWLGTSAQATISNSTISGNGWVGIGLGHSARATIRQSILQGNGTDEDCQKPDKICNGIEVRGEAQVELIDSQVLGNADWGVGAWLAQCGYDEDDFTGQVALEGMELEDISGNNTSGDQDGMGNPGEHPWNRPEVPDGQVCLP